LTTKNIQFILPSPSFDKQTNFEKEEQTLILINLSYAGQFTSQTTNLRKNINAVKTISRIKII